MSKQIRVGDEVRVICGDDKGKCGRVLKALRQKNRLVISGVNVARKSVKKNAKNPDGARMEIELSIHRSNVKRVENQGGINGNSRVAKELEVGASE